MAKKEITNIEDIPGVGDKIAEKLKEAGFTDLMAIATAPLIELSEKAGLGDATAQKIVSLVRENLNMNFMSGNEVLERRGTVKRISTGSTNLNLLLGGGVETQAITEAFGQFASGKTQIAHQLCVNVQKPEEEGGLNGCAVYIDTEGTFRPERIIQMAKSAKIDPDTALSRIRFARAYSSDHQVLLSEKLSELMESNKDLPIKLLIVDSIMGLFRAEYSGRGTLADRQQKLNHHIHFLQRLSDRYNIAIYVTNQVMSRPDQFFGDPTTPIGGHVLAHAATYRLYFRKGKEDKRIARLIDSPNLPEGECIFKVTAKGLTD